MDSIDFLADWREPDTITRSFRTVVGGQLHIRRAGLGPPLLLLHELPGSGRLMDHAVLALAAAGFSVTVPDLPGFGLSDGNIDVLSGLSQVMADLGPCAIVSCQSSWRLAGAIAAMVPGAHHCASLRGPKLVPKPVPVNPDGSHLDQLWHQAQAWCQAEPYPAQVDRTQKLLAEWLLITEQGWALVERYRAIEDPPLALQSDIESASILVRRGLAGLVRSTRHYVPGTFGAVHVRMAEPILASSRPPLVCLHASPLSGVVYEAALARFGVQRLALAPDTPGFGESDAPPQPVEIEDLAEAVFAACSSWLSDQIDLLGFHTGSMIAAELAARYPSRIRKIAMISAPIFTEDERNWFREHYQAVPESADGAHNKLRWQAFCDWRGPRQTWANYARNHAQGLRGGPGYFWGHRAAFNHDFAARLQVLSQPILVLNPGDDLATQSRRAATLMQNGSVLEMPDQGHGMLDSDTDRFVEIVLDFLDRDSG